MRTYRAEGDLTLIVYAGPTIEAGEGVSQCLESCRRKGDLGQCTT